MLCPKCRKEIVEDASFCSFCGTQIIAQDIEKSLMRNGDFSLTECLGHIIELEQRMKVQEETMTELNEKINQIDDTPHEIQKRKIMKRRYSDDPKYHIYDYYSWHMPRHWIISFAFGAVFWLIDYFKKWIKWPMWLNDNGLIERTVILVIICFLIPVILIFVFDPFVMSLNTDEENEAEKRQKSIYEKECFQAEADYQNDVATEQKRLAFEKARKRTLMELCDQLNQKNQDTSDLLKQFYSSSGLYEDYANFVAVTYIYEYLKSGICSKLTGIDGAYKVFKDEMYQKFQLERLDNIVGLMKQLHFDNLTINRSLKQISSQVNSLSDSMDDFIRCYQDNVTEEKESISQTNDRLSSFEESYIKNSSISQYNQKCIETELKEANWLKLYDLAVNSK